MVRRSPYCLAPRVTADPGGVRSWFAVLRERGQVSRDACARRRDEENAMYQRTSDRDLAPRPAGDRRVGLFIDYENIRRGLEDPGGASEVVELAARLREAAAEQGRVLIASVYGDWTFARTQAREFRRQLIEPRIVLGKETGDDSAYVALSLDALETIFAGPDLDVYVIVAGDNACSELIQRLRRADRTVVQVGFEAGATVHAGDRFLSLEELLGIKRARKSRKVDFSMYDWAPFIRLMDELEQGMPFVGFGWLLKKKLNAENSGCSSMQDKQELMDRAVEEGILVLYKVDNIEEGADPVTACKLNRENPRVKEFVEA
jgi:hypothetical protein